MAIKTQAFVAAAATLAGISAGASVLESTLDNMTINGLKISEVSDGSRQCVVFAGVVANNATTYRPVCDGSGNVRLYGDVAAAANLAKKTNIGNGDVQYFKVVAQTSPGNPVKRLIAQHKQITAENTRVTAVKDALASEKTAAEGLGWNTSVGTPERAEYDDMVLRLAALNEAVSVSGARKTALGTALTNAGISPTTYLPV